MGLVDRRLVVCPTLAMGFWVPLHYLSLACHSGPPTPSNTGFATPPGNSAEFVKEVQEPELRHQRVPSAEQQGRTPSYSNRLNDHPQDQSTEGNNGELG